VQCTQAKQRREDRHDNCNRTLTFLSILTSPTRVFLLYYSSSSSSLHIFGGANNMPPKKMKFPLDPSCATGLMTCLSVNF
jgi:hypothetical protein